MLLFTDALVLFHFIALKMFDKGLYSEAELYCCFGFLFSEFQY